MMQAIILCGGKGTRLNALYADRPKILVPVAGRAFIEWQLEWLARGGVTDIHLAGGHLADVLCHWLEAHGARDNPDQPVYSVRCAGTDLRVTVSTETTPLGTGGGLKFVEPFIRSDPFFVINGDSIMPSLDFGAMVGQHNRFGGGATLAVTRIEESGRYGTVEFDAAARITAFREKASRTEGWVNGGVYLMSRAVMADIQAAKNISIETELFPDLAKRGRLHAFSAPPPLLDMGTPEGIRNMEAYLCES
jgi:NDP-sugar pyrophosphorylase family protein